MVGNMSVGWPGTKSDLRSVLETMTTIGSIETLWRYPVKSMAGERFQEVFFGYAGGYLDPPFALHSKAAPTGFPYLTARERSPILSFRPPLLPPNPAAKPPHQAEA